MNLRAAVRYVAASLALISTPIPVAADPAWRLFANKHGWEVKAPKCWTESGIEVSAKDAPIVIFRAGRACPSELAQHQDSYFGVNQNLAVKSTAPEDRISTHADLYKRGSIKFVTGERIIRGKVMNTISSVAPKTDSSDLIYSLVVEMTCDFKNTRVSAHYVIPEKDRHLPIEKLRLPRVLERMVDSFVCTKNLK